MSFENKNLSLIAYANGFSLWHYKTTDAIETVCNPGYFARAKNLCNTGDIIIVNAKNGTSIKKIVLDEKEIKLQKLN